MLLNRELNLSCPEGFHVMGEEERSSLRFIEEGPGLCLGDPDRHMIISIGYRAMGMFSSFLLDTGDAAMKMETNVRDAMKTYEYQMDGFRDRLVDGKKAVGFRYRYVSGDTQMTAESWLLKQKQTFYYFHCYMRSALEEESLAVWEKFLDTIRWS